MFTLVAVVGAVPLVLLDQSIEIKDGLLDALVYVVLGCALAVASIHLWRHRRP